MLGGVPDTVGMPPQPGILVDTDGGLDDLIAIGVVAQAHRLWGVTTTWGNVSAMAAARNVSAAVPGCELWCGDRTPPKAWRPSAVHGLDGVGGTLRGPQRCGRPRYEPGAAQVISRFARENPGGTLLCIGPLTNLARAIELDAEGLGRLGVVVVLAGVGLGRDRSLRTVADTNTRVDPTAALAVARATWLPVRWVGLDVSRVVRLGVDDLPRSGVVSFESMRAYGLRRRLAGRAHPWSTPCHDLVAAATALTPDIATWCHGRVRIRADQEAVRVVGSPSVDGPHLIARGVDAAAVRGRLVDLAAHIADTSDTAHTAVDLRRLRNTRP